MQLTINTVGKGGIIDLSRLVIIPHGCLEKGEDLLARTQGGSGTSADVGKSLDGGNVFCGIRRLNKQPLE